MKIRITLMTENNEHSDVSDDKLRELATSAWNMLLASASTDDDKGYVESVEIVER